MPEMLWKSYIEFETNEHAIDNARRLYDRLIEKSNHVKVWISYGKFELEQAKGYAEACKAAGGEIDSGMDELSATVETAR